MREIAINSFGILLLVGLCTTSVHAEVYKCKNSDGTTAYQPRPCDSGGTAIKTSESKANQMVGCYRTTRLGHETGKYDMRLEVKSLGNEKFDLFMAESKLPDKNMANLEKALTLKIATPEEVQMLSDGLGVKFLYGLSSDWKGDPKNYKPVGMYRVKDKNGKEGDFAYLFFVNGPVKKVDCR